MYVFETITSSNNVWYNRINNRLLYLLYLLNLVNLRYDCSCPFLFSLFKPKRRFLRKPTFRERTEIQTVKLKAALKLLRTSPDHYVLVADVYATVSNRQNLTY
jgi:hypothetical protein